MQQSNEAQHRKQQIRAEATARRRHQADAVAHSRRIFKQLFLLPEYVHAKIVLSYVSFRSEVCTRQLIPRAWEDGKQVAVPYCVADHLELFRLDGYEDLTPGTLGILEPRGELRALADRQILPASVDLVIVPGLAFDPQCGRVGYGKGYYDRLLHQLRPGATAIAVAFQCQIFPEIPLLPYDVRVDRVITETSLYVRRQPRCNFG